MNKNLWQNAFAFIIMEFLWIKKNRTKHIKLKQNRRLINWKLTLRRWIKIKRIRRKMMWSSVDLSNRDVGQKQSYLCCSPHSCFFFWLQSSCFSPYNKMKIKNNTPIIQIYTFFLIINKWLSRVNMRMYPSDNMEYRRCNFDVNPLLFLVSPNWLIILVKWK